MPKEDYLSRFFEKMARVLAAMADLREKGYPEDVNRYADEVYHELLKTDTLAVMQIPVEEFINSIFSSGLKSHEVQYLACVTYESGRAFEFQDTRHAACDFYLKSLHLYHLLNQLDRTYSTERENYIEELTSRLENLSAGI